MAAITNAHEVLAAINQTEGKDAKLPSSAKSVLDILEDHEPRTFSDISDRVNWAPRTVRNALRRLIEEGLVVRKFNFRDARQVFYMRA